MANLSKPAAAAAAACTCGPCTHPAWKKRCIYKVGDADASSTSMKGAVPPTAAGAKQQPWVTDPSRADGPKLLELCGYGAASSTTIWRRLKSTRYVTWPEALGALRSLSQTRSNKTSINDSRARVLAELEAFVAAGTADDHGATPTTTSGADASAPSTGFEPPPAAPVPEEIPNVAAEDSPPRDAIVQLRFILHWAFFVPPKALNEIQKWKRLCGYFAFMSTNEDARGRMTALWLSYCTLESNRALPRLNRVEGCIGGNNNQQHKQIRGVLRSTKPDAAWSPENSELRFEVRNSKVDMWTYEELNDLICAFEKLCVDVVHPDDPVSGEVSIRWHS